MRSRFALRFDSLARASLRMSDPALAPFLAQHRAGRMAEAEAGYRRCLERGIDATLPLSALLLQQARYAEAVDLLEPQSALRPRDASIAVNLSIALRKVARGEDALRIARDACAASPGHAGACNALGLAALDLDRADEALAAFEAGLRAAPGQVALELHRAKCLHRLGRAVEALAVLEHIVARAPRSLEGWCDLASVQASLGRHDDALASSARALALAPDDVEVVLAHAVATLRVGDVATALSRLESITRTHADDARAWAWLGRARLREGNTDAARTALLRARSIDAADPVVAHLLAALSGTLPQEVERDYVRDLFDDFADRFEQTLVDRLAYCVPHDLLRFIDANGAADAVDVLDLGCGTGLMGDVLAAPGRSIDGVDLSARMLVHARAKGVYRSLHEAELLDFLRAADATWDLVVAADVFIYIADLRPVFAATHERLRRDGLFAFSIERSDGRQTQLPPETGRLRHSPDLLADALADAGFADIRRQTTVLRLENGSPVAGEFLLARRA